MSSLTSLGGNTYLFIYIRVCVIYICMYVYMQNNTRLRNIYVANEYVENFPSMEKILGMEIVIN